MPGLILKLRAHEEILVNGVVMQNGDRNARLIIKTPNVNVLRLRDAIRAEEADSPVKHLCYLAQRAVAGEVAPEEAAAQLERGLAQLGEALQGLDGSEPLGTAVAELGHGNFYAVLRALRRVLPLEAELLGRAAPPPTEGSTHEAG